MDQNKNVMEFFVRKIIRILETIFCHENIFYYVKTKVKRVHFKFLSLSFKIELHNVVSCFAFVLCFADLFSCSQTYKKKGKENVTKTYTIRFIITRAPQDLPFTCSSNRYTFTSTENGNNTKDSD